MRIKHFAGYGTVEAKKINDGKAKLHVRVVGNHEWGLQRADMSDLYHWLVKRFDKSVPDELTWLRTYPKVEFEYDFSGSVDAGDYYFYY